jgi:type I restriction-modification system DNA methylase subunit
VIREYIVANAWNVSVYRLVDTTFNSVLTTSCITIVDKSKREGKWSYFEEMADGGTCQP